MKSYQRNALSEFLGDFVVYRNLVPVDQRLPGFSDFFHELKMHSQYAPRKSSPEYAKIIIRILAAARTLDTPHAEIKRLIFLGDSRMNDGTAFVNICRAGGWPGIAFIGAENDQPRQTEILDEGDNCTLYLANRWNLLAAFDTYLSQQNFPLDEGTVVLIDMDKTMLGARGRNDSVIDRARVDAAFQTVSAALGDDFDALIFDAAYQRFNHSDYHAFTSDNQDYLVYICLIIASGIYDLDDFTDQVKSGRWSDFGTLLASVNARQAEFPSKLRAIHSDVYACFEVGDPTPFKDFRRKEYQITAAHMGHLESGCSLDIMLNEEIVITQEVRAAALKWRQRGGLIFGLSDKPDESSIPTDALAKLGYLPLHQITTDVVGDGV
ncbi:MAG: hypothetical protein ABFS03_02435 [Chloroflexota bacterium]